MKISIENIVSAYETKFVKLFDIQYKEGAHYYDATRRNREDVVAIMDDESFANMLPDAVTIALIVKESDSCEPKILLSKEYRYPTGHFLLSPPAGLIDPEDKASGLDVESILGIATKREILEETGLIVKDTDKIEIVNPCLFSTPGLTDESNAIIKVEIADADLTQINQSGAVGTELFDGYVLLTREEAVEVLKSGRDEKGFYLPTYTWVVLMSFISDIWN